jgi:hypothetical protein
LLFCKKLFVPEFLVEGWELKISCSSIKCYLVNGCGDSCKRRIIYGDRQLLREVWDTKRQLVLREDAKALQGVPLEEYSNWLGDFSNFVSFKVGDGARIRFWHDVWCEEAALKSSFLELYSITCDKEALVSDYLDSSGTYIHCNPSFIKAIQDWEQESLVSFLNLIFASKTHLRDADRIL